MAQASKVSDAELEDWGPLDEATDQPMATHGTELWVDGDASAGIWQCAPGPSRWKLETNEVIYLVAGRMTVTPDDGDAVGDRCRRHGRVPEGLVGHLGSARDRAKGLLDLLSSRDHQRIDRDDTAR